MKKLLKLIIFALIIISIVGCSKSTEIEEKETFKPESFTSPEKIEVIETTVKETPIIETVEKIIEETTENETESLENITEEKETIPKLNDCNPCLDENVKVGEMYVYLSEDGYLCSDENCTCKSSTCEMTNEQSRFNIRDSYSNTKNETLSLVKLTASCFSLANIDIRPSFKFGTNNEGISYSPTASFIGEMKENGLVNYRWQFSLKSIFDKFPKAEDKTKIHCVIKANSTQYENLENKTIDFDIKIRGNE